jgi:pimeloyl-ACP methyl ester carboxylesterase
VRRITGLLWIGIVASILLSGCRSIDVGAALSDARWLVAGPFEIADGTANNALGHDYLAAEGGEATISPQAGDTIGSIEWIPTQATNGAIDFLRRYPGSTDAVAYAYTEFDSPAGTEAALKLGSDDGISVWLNGVRVWDNRVYRALMPDEDALRVSLLKGTNRLLVKVDQAAGDWGFTIHLVALSDEAGAWDATGGRGLRISFPQQIVRSVEDAVCVVGTNPGYVVSEPVVISIFDSRGSLIRTIQGRTGDRIPLALPEESRGVFRVNARAEREAIYEDDAVLLIGDESSIAAEAVARARAIQPDDPQPAATLTYLADLLEGELIPSLSTTERRLRAVLEINEIVAFLDGNQWSAEQFRGQRQWAYRSGLDDSYQPYTLYLPETYDPAREYPLIVSLHGYTDNDWNTATNVAVRRPDDFIVVAPYGRGDVGYRTVGERDVLDVIDLVESIYSVDPDRVYLMGWSMGGLGTWRIGLLYPDLFAAIAPFCGWGGIVYLGNLINTPTLIVHGDADPSVPIRMDRNAASRLEQIGAPVEYRELPGVGHDTWSPTVLARFGVDFLSFFRSNVRNRWPERLAFSVRAPRYGHHFWMEVDELAESAWVGRIDAEVVDETLVQIETDGVAALELDLRHPSLAADGSITVRIDGVDLRFDARSAEAVLVNDAGRWTGGVAPDPDVARHGGDGVFGMVLDRTTIVYGTLDPDRTELLRRQAEALADWAPTGALPVGSPIGRFPVKADREVTDRDVREGNLFLLGGANEYALSARQLEYMHLSVSDGAVVVDDQAIPGNGFLVTHPTGDAPAHLTTIFAAPAGQNSAQRTLAGLVLGMRAYNVNESATDALAYPDVVVFPGPVAAAGGQPVWRGSFDRNWEHLRQMQ